jgi:hypothetical protein
MLATTLIAISAGIVLVMGLAHLRLTYFSQAFAARDREVEEKLAIVAPVISPKTTMKKIHTGFHVSHSLSVIMFGAIYLYLALAQSAVLFGSPFLLAIGGIFLLIYVILAIRYWFELPLMGVGVAFALYMAGVVAAIVIA